ncbi:hypothetical protein V6N13_076494 [Hibiscus sabdariffa]
MVFQLSVKVRTEEFEEDRYFIDGVCPFDRSGEKGDWNVALDFVPCIYEQPLDDHLPEKSPSFDGGVNGGGNTHSAGVSHTNSVYSLGIRSASDHALLDVPISLEANMEVIGDGIAFDGSKDLGLTESNPQAHTISNESRLQEVQVNVIDDQALLDISQPVSVAKSGSNKHIGLRAGLDRMCWWATTCKAGNFEVFNTFPVVRPTARRVRNVSVSWCVWWINCAMG